MTYDMLLIVAHMCALVISVILHTSYIHVTLKFIVRGVHLFICASVHSDCVSSVALRFAGAADAGNSICISFQDH